MALTTQNWLDPWPEVFSQSIDEPFGPDLSVWQRKGHALANQLAAWANCHAGKSLGYQIPENFGEVMAKLGGITGALTPEDCSEAAAKWHRERLQEGPAEAGGG